MRAAASLLCATSLVVGVAFASGSGRASSGGYDLPEIRALATDPPWARRLAADAEAPVVLFYFSPACPHSRAALPRVDALTYPLALLGVTLVGVVADLPAGADLAAVRAELGVHFPLIRLTGEILDDLQYPQFVPMVMIVQ